MEHSKSAAPIVPVSKKDGKFRICGDYKVTINGAIDIDQYLLPRPSDLFATLTNGKLFSKLDLSQAYQQMRLEETSAQYLRLILTKDYISKHVYPLEWPRLRPYSNEPWIPFYKVLMVSYVTLMTSW